MIQAVLLILYSAIGFGIIGLIMWLFIMAGSKIGDFLRRKFDEK